MTNAKKFTEMIGKEGIIVDEFYRWAVGCCIDNFHAYLFKLICKSDDENQSKLALGFPLEVELIQNYQGKSGWYDEFIEEYDKKLWRRKD